MEQVIWKKDPQEIKKQVLKEGKWGDKPYEYSECYVSFEDCPNILTKYNDSKIIIGDTDSELTRLLDLCLISMHEEEMSKFVVTTSNQTISFIVTLLKLDFQGFIFEWDAEKKYNIAQFHKEKGVELYKDEKVLDSAYRFTKGLKIILSIPIDVQGPPDEIDGVTLEKINTLKANLFNNMASCYLKKEKWEMVIEFCNKVFRYDKDNVKALYKIGVAYRNDKNFEQARRAFERVLKFEPNHHSAKEHLHFVKVKLQEANIRVNTMMRKMISEVIN